MNAHLIRARLLMGQERYEMALAELQQAVAIDPNDPSVHCGMAVALLRLEKWSEAKRSVEIALEHGPEDPNVHWTRTLVMLERQHLAEAETSIRTAIQLDPDDADHYGLLARVLYERNKLPEALAAADDGLAVDATNDLCLTYRARTLTSLGRHEESSKITESLLREDPLDSWHHCLRGEELLSEGRSDEARVHFLESLRLRPGNEAARAGFAISLKAQSPIYGAFLALLIRLGRFKMQTLWGFVIGAILLFHFGSRLVADSPGAVVALSILRELGYSGIILLLLANPMFDLILRFHKEGRHVLSRDEKRATNWYLICFALAGLCALWALVASKSFLPKQMGYALLFLCIPIREIFDTGSAYVRSRLAGMTIGLGLLMLLAPVLGPLGLLLSVLTKQLFLSEVFVHYLIWMPLIVILFSAFSENVRQWLEQKRTD